MSKAIGSWPNGVSPRKLRFFSPGVARGLIERAWERAQMEGAPVEIECGDDLWAMFDLAVELGYGNNIVGEQRLRRHQIRKLVVIWPDGRWPDGQWEGEE